MQSISEYPFKADNLQKNITLNTVPNLSYGYGYGYKPKDPNCKDIQYKLNKENHVMFGSTKPLYEKCPIISGNLTYDNVTSGNNVWNNSTKRKIIVNHNKDTSSNFNN